ncbi:hypothetical protein FHX42_000717 [Saccharopolyspora lacisalsi]|uniref:Uncharacterized protein n=1 Tax=Halosaccharopolyspora lacisalsi TaxID=1000566 RepID=A0A839DXC3_9PSEU|nr:hypothetical protein [Halosaccharopolyspora lacisalsi]MBA8823388.1 hypothetical protein [Halosaccharopolyspora lacisalsi]
MRASVRLLGTAFATAGLLAMGSPAFAAGGPPEVDVEDVQAQLAENEGGDGGNGGDGGLGVNACGLIPVSVLGENSVECSAGNGGAGGDGGDAGSTQK